MLFVADGLRPGMVNEKTAPTMTALMAEGVRFTNTHSLFPTFTTANASGLATGHQLGDTGDFSNNIYVAFPLPPGGSVVAPLENNRVLGEVDQHFAGDYLNEETILKAARGAGFSTAAIGKLGPVLIFDHTERTGQHSVIVDDVTGHSTGIPLSDEVKQRLAAAQLPLQTPARGDNAKPGTNVANVVQQAWLTDVVTKALLPMFKERDRPFVIVFWSRDPDATQHGQGDSPLRLVPGINGPTSLAAIRNADDCLARLMTALKEQGLDGTTDIVLTSDHGFSTISKESATSWAATQSYKDVPAGLLPPGFVAIDLAHALGLKLYEANGTEAAPGTHPSHALIGDDAKKPSVVVAGNGGSDLIYLPTADKALAAKIVSLLSEQDYTSGIFVDDALGKIAGHPAPVGDRAERRRRYARAVHRRQFPLLLDGLRRSDDLRRRGGRHDPAAGPGHAWQLLARRHAQHHGCPGAELPPAFREQRAGQQRRSRPHDRAPAGSQDRRQGPTYRPRAERGAAQRRDAQRAVERGSFRARCRRTRHDAADAECRRDSLFRCRRLSGPNPRPAGGVAARFADAE